MFSGPKPVRIWLRSSSQVPVDDVMNAFDAAMPAVRETVYNLFLYVEAQKVKELGIVAHELDGTEEEKLKILQSRVDDDCKAADRYQVRGAFTWAEYCAMGRLGRDLETFEQMFQDYNAPSNPLCAVTPIVDGSPRVDAVTGMGATDQTEIQNTPQAPGFMVDYLRAYVRDGQLDLPRLINDDYFQAIQLLLSAGRYVSSAKLLMSFFDTVAFVDLGDVAGGFCKWLDTYAVLAPLGITSKELWEFRNGLLHMTNLNSRAVASGSTAPLILYLGPHPPTAPPGHTPNAKYFNLKALLDETSAACSRWMDTYNDKPDKLIQFVARYDLTISDARLSYSQPALETG